MWKCEWLCRGWNLFVGIYSSPWMKPIFKCWNKFFSFESIFQIYFSEGWRADVEDGVAIAITLVSTLKVEINLTLGRNNSVHMLLLGPSKSVHSLDLSKIYFGEVFQNTTCSCWWTFLITCFKNLLVGGYLSYAFQNFTCWWIFWL